MTTPGIDADPATAASGATGASAASAATSAREELVGGPARDLVRVTETRPDGRRLTLYRRDP